MVEEPGEEGCCGDGEAVSFLGGYPHFHRYRAASLGSMKPPTTVRDADTGLIFNTHKSVWGCDGFDGFNGVDGFVMGVCL